MPRLISGIVKKTPAANADPNRYAWLDLTNAEPDLGVPSSNGSLFISTVDGTRSWSNTITITGSVATINTLTVSGNSNLGSNSNVNITGGSPGQFIVTDGAGNLAWSSAAISVASGISNDQSSVAIVAPNGNITMSVAGTLGVVVVSNAGASVTGNVSVSGNITAANITANTGVFTGNGAGLSAIAGANVIGTVASATTATTAGTVTTNAQGNITSVGTLTGLDVNGNITAANITSNTGVFTGNGSGLSAIAGANVTGTVANATTAATAGTVTTNAQPNITSVGTLSNLNVTGNANINGTTIDTSGNITAPYVFANVFGNISGNLAVSGSNTEVIFNNDGNSGASNAFTFNKTSNVLTVTGNIGANFFTGNGSALSSITGANVSGQVSFAATANTVAGANVTGVVANATFASNAGFATTAGTVTTNAQPNITSTGTLTALEVNGNITAGNITANTGVFTGNGSGLTALAGANVTGTVANATFATSTGTAGTVTTADQPNITSVGTLSNLNVSGNSIIGGNLTVNGNLVYVNVETLAIEDPIIQLQTGPNGAAPIANSGKDVGTALNYYDTQARVAFMGWDVSNVEFGLASQASITSEVVTFTSYGNLRVGNIIGNGQALTALAGANVTGAVAFATTANTVAGANVTGTVANATFATSAGTAGTVTTNAQPNITSVGTLSNLNVTGNANINGTTIDTSGNITAPYVFANVFGNISGNLAVSGSNTEVIFNNDGNSGASNAFTFNKTSNVLTISGNVSATNFIGNGSALTALNASNVSSGTLDQARLANSNVILGSTTLALGSTTTTVAGLTSVTSTTFVGALTGAATTAGSVTTAAQGNITSVGTLTGLDVNGNITAANITANTGVFTGNGAGLSAIAGANVTGTVANATFATSTGTAGTVTTNAQPNITSVGNLTGLVVGNATSNVVISNSGTINATGNITAPFVFANVLGNISGNFAVTGSNGEVIFNKEGNAGSSNGFSFNTTSNALSVNGTITATNFTANTGVFTGNGSALTALNASNVSSGTLDQARLANSNVILGSTTLALGTTTTTIAGLSSVTSTTFVGALTGAATSATTAGTVTTNAQPNITSVGTLTGLTVGNATANTVFGNGTINATGNLTAPFFLGNVIGNISGNFAVTGSNGEVIFNKEGNAGSSNGFTFNNTTNALAATGNITGSNLVTGGIVSATGNVTTSANLVTNLIVGRTTGITITATGTNQNITLAPTGTGTVDVSSKRITSLATPSASTDAATKQYVDDVAQGLTVKTSCNAATTGTLAAASSGTITYNNGSSGVGATLTTTGSYTTIDGVTLVNGDRILVKNEATAANNGIYVRTSTTVLTRATDFDNSPAGEVAGAFTFISGGTTNADAGFVCTTDNPVVMGTTAITFTQFSGAGTYIAGTGLTLTGSEFSIANTAVTSGSYGSGDRVASFTVNAQGQLTAAANVVIAANAANLSGTVLKSTVITSSLTSVGTLGSLAVTGNITSGNANLGDTARANFFVGDGSQLTNIPIGTNLSNGTSSVSIPAINGNVNTTVAGTIRIVATTSGATVAGTLGVSANVTAPQLISNIAAGTSPFVVTSNTVVTNLNADLLDGYNPVVANTANTIALRDASGNLSANFFIGNGSQLTGIVAPAGTSIVNGTSNVVVDASGNVRTSIASTPNVFIVSASGANIAGRLGVTGNISIGSSYFIGDGSQLTNLPITQFLANGTSNVVVTNNGPVNISVDGSANVVVFSKTIANITGSLGVSGNANVGNIGATQGVFTNVIGNGSSLSSITGANVTGAVAFATTANAVAGANVSGAVSSATTAGTVTTAAQPNITSVGTLTSLGVTGTLQTTALTTGASSTAGTITGDWTLTSGSKLQATYADIAEKYVADATYEPGTVLLFGGEQEVMLSNAFNSTKVAGVVTTNPAYSMNSALEAEYVAEIALQGRVPCKVIGPIEKGDLMVSANNGHAIANNDARAGTIIGKSLENFNGDFGIIEVAVGRF